MNDPAIVSLWRTLPEWQTEAKRARVVVDRLELGIERTRLALLLGREVAAREAAAGAGPTVSTHPLGEVRALLRAAAMAIAAHQTARSAAVGGDPARIAPRLQWLAKHLADLLHAETRSNTADVSSLIYAQMLAAAGRLAAPPWPDCQAALERMLEAARGLRSGRSIGAGAGGILENLPKAAPGLKSSGRSSAPDLTWVTARLESEGRLQAWRYGDEAEPRLLLRTPAMFNARQRETTGPSWFRVFVPTGRLEIVKGAAAETASAAVLDWQPLGRAPARRRAGRPSLNVATEDLVVWLDPQLDVEAARREARRQQWRAFRVVRRALSNDPARVAEAVLGGAARARDLVYLSAGHQGGERRRVLFERYPTLGYRALTAGGDEAQKIGKAVDDGRPVAHVAAGEAWSDTDLAKALAEDVARHLDGEHPLFHDDLGAARLKLWHLTRPGRGDAEDAAIEEMLQTRGNYHAPLRWEVKALLLADPRRFAGWLDQNPIRLAALVRVLNRSVHATAEDFVRLELAAMAWRAAGRRLPDALLDLGDVVGMLAGDLLAPRIRTDERFANAIVLHNHLSRSTALNANDVARLVVWGLTFDPQAGPTRWSELYRTCRQLHRPVVLATRDDVLRDVAKPCTFIPPAGWTALAPDGRIGVRHLADENQVRDEGRRMEHCVGTYAGRVMAGNCDLFHLEGPGRGATLELVEAWVGGWPIYRPRQLRGHRNTEPPAALEARANQLARDMVAAVPGLPKERREAIRKRRFLQTRHARNRNDTEDRDPTPAERQALWDRVYSTRVPAAWRRLAPGRELAMTAWSSRYIGQHFDTCVTMDPACTANLTSLIMMAKEVRASIRLDQMARIRHRPRQHRGA